MKKLVSTFSGIKASVVSFLFLALCAVNSFAGDAILDLEGVTDAVKDEVAGASPVIAVILGLTVAIGIVIAIFRRVRN